MSVRPAEVVVADPMARTGPPVFLVGCPRSGTTLLRLMLDAHPHIACGPETHFLLEMQAIVERHWRRVRLFGFDRAYWLTKIAGFFDGFQMQYAQTKGKARWADKTPRYTPHIAYLNDLFPDSQFVHLIRDGRDVVASHLQRWGYRSAMLCASRTWREHVSVAREFGRTLPATRYLELRYEDLVRNPEPVLRELVAFLGEPWSDQVLRYEEAEHDFADEQGHLRTARQTTAAVVSSRVGKGRKTLDPLLRAVLWRRSGGLMRELGYS